VLILLAASATGVLAGVGVGALIAGGDVPFALEPPAVLTAAALLIALGLLGAAAAIVRIATVNPLAALGAQR
jgi:putative ABC transport system permease protein